MGLHPVAVLKYNMYGQAHIHNKKNIEELITINSTIKQTNTVTQSKNTVTVFCGKTGFVLCEVFWKAYVASNANSLYF